MNGAPRRGLSSVRVGLGSKRLPHARLSGIQVVQDQAWVMSSPNQTHLKITIASLPPRRRLFAKADARHPSTHLRESSGFDLAECTFCRVLLVIQSRLVLSGTNGSLKKQARTIQRVESGVRV